MNCQQCFDPRDEALARLGRVLTPGGRFVSLTHDWAIERRQPLPAWREHVERDAAAAGLTDPAWSSARYRSGAATQLTLTAASVAPHR